MWITACAIDDIDTEDVLRFDHQAHGYEIDRDLKGASFATVGPSSHEQVELCNGLVMGDLIECPKSNGRFNFKTGAALRSPASVVLKTFLTRVLGNDVQIEVD